MEVAEDKLYLENLEEEIIQRNNIVTYKWLMKAIKVTANVAKQMLYEFVEKQKADGIELNVIYLVAGQRKSDNDTMVHEIRIVPSSQLDFTKSKFSTITSVHVYGVHKSPIQDLSMLYTVDYDSKGSAVEDIKKSCAIQCRAVSFRNADVDEPESVSQESPVIITRKEHQKIASTQRAPLPKSKTLNSKKKLGNDGALASMFQNMGKKKKVEPTEGGLNESNTVVRQGKNADECHTLISVKKEGVKQQSLTSLNTDGDKKSSDHTRVTSRGMEKPATKKRLVNKRKPDTANNSALKKRRRIIEVSESSSEEDEEIDSPIPSPPTEIQSDDSEEPLPPNLESQENVKGARRKRILVEDVVKDQDGYLVIQKKWTEVDETEGSDNENEEPIPPPPKAKPATKTTTNLPKPSIMKNKQATLTNFFKRK